MHPSDVLVIGPIRPCGSRVLRVPVRNVFIGGLVAAIATALASAVLVFRPDRQQWSDWLPNGFAITTPGTSRADTGDNQTFEVDSNPAGATVRIDGHDYGRTPAVTSAPPGKTVTLQRDGFLDAFAISTGRSLSLQLWQAQPGLRTIRPPTPGALITSANFLPDGRVAMAVQVPPTGERQAWAYDPIAGQVERLGHAPAPGALPSSVAIAPDGLASAAIVHLDGLDGASADHLVLDDGVDQHEVLGGATPNRGVRFLDLSWSPEGGGVLVLGVQQVKGGNRFDLLFVNRNGVSRLLAELAAQPVAGSWVWAPDGHAVAFLARGNELALATVDLGDGRVRYVDDLASATSQTAGSVAPATWDQAGRLLYAAALRTGSHDSSNSNHTPVLLEVEPGRTDAHRVGTIEPVFAPIVRDDGILLTLARTGGDELVLRPVDPSGHVLAEQRLGVSVPGSYAARWDLHNGQLLILRGGTDGALDVLLVRFVAERLP